VRETLNRSAEVRCIEYLGAIIGAPSIRSAREPSFLCSFVRNALQTVLSHCLDMATVRAFLHSVEFSYFDDVKRAQMKIRSVS
jgi:hypothetical protein